MAGMYEGVMMMLKLFLSKWLRGPVETINGNSKVWPILLITSMLCFVAMETMAWAFFSRVHTAKGVQKRKNSLDNNKRKISIMDTDWIAVLTGLADSVVVTNVGPDDGVGEKDPLGAVVYRDPLLLRLALATTGVGDRQCHFYAGVEVSRNMRVQDESWHTCRKKATHHYLY